MKPDTLEFLHTTMARINADERAAREEYYAYLLTQGDSSDTLDEHIAKYSSFVALGVPASPPSIDALRKLSAPELPETLLNFYRTVGSIKGGDRLKGLVLHSPDTLILKSSPNPTSPWDCVPSMGLVDIIRWSWGNDRFEFDPASGDGLTQAEVEHLNARYSAVGWYDVLEGEGREYLIFDRSGAFATLFYHQDAFDELYADSLLPMLSGEMSVATSFDEALVTLLTKAEADEWEELDE